MFLITYYLFIYQTYFWLRNFNSNPQKEGWVLTLEFTLCNIYEHMSQMCCMTVVGVWSNHILFKNIFEGLPWWCSGWESACQCMWHGFEPWSGKIPHATEQLGPWATTTEPARLEPVLRNKRGCHSERPAHRDEEWPPLAATRESPRTETKA